MTRALLLLLLVLVALPVAAAEERDAPVRIAFEQPLHVETNHFGIYLGRRKVGWARLSIDAEEQDDRPVFVSRSRIVADAALGALRGTLDFTSVDVFDGAWPHALLACEETKTDLSGTRRLSLQRGDGVYEGWAEDETEAEILRIVDPGYTLVDRLTVLEWMRWRPTAGRAIRVRELDITNLRTEWFDYEVIERTMTRAGVARVDLARAAMRCDSKGKLGEAVFDAEGRLLQGPLAGRLEMRMESAAQAKDLSLDSDLFAFGRAPTAEPLGRVAGIQRLELAAYGRTAKTLPSSQRVQVAWNAEDLEARLTIVSGGEGIPATVLERETARVEPDPDAPGLSAVRELSARAVGDAQGTEARLGRLLGFVRGHLRDAWLPHEPNLREILRDRTGDPSAFARLFVSLARAAGIAARPVVGIAYLGDDAQAFGGHVWCEVLVRGRWQEVDPTLGQRRVDATHIPFVRDSTDLFAVQKQSRHLQLEVRRIVR